MKYLQYLVFSLGLTLTGCASVHPQVEVRLADGLDAERSHDLVERSFDAPDPGKAVKVIDASMTQLNMKAYDVVGSVIVELTPSGRISFRNWLWMQDYESGALTGYCVWQVPLKIVTIGLWSYLSPLHWPCLAGNPGDVDDRMAYLLRYVRTITAQAGGDVALVTTGDSERMHTDSAGAVLGCNIPLMLGSSSTSVETIRATNMTFTILKKKSDAAGATSRR